MKTTTSINFECEMLKSLKQMATETDRSVSNIVYVLISNSPQYREFVIAKRKEKQCLQKSKNSIVIKT